MKPLLVHFQPRVSPTGARTDVRLASGGSAAASGLGGFRWQTAVVRRPRLSIDLLSPALDGRIQPGRADLVINLARIRDVDAFALYWLGAPVKIYDATGLDLATAPIEFVGMVRSATLNVENDQLALNLEVSTQALEKPALYNEFAGTGGAEGSAEFYGKVKPAGFGSVKNIEPVWFDTTRNIGMIDGYGNCTAITALFEGGNDFGARVANYASYDTLAAAIDSKAIAPGRWGTCVAAGLVGLGAPPVKPITVDATFGTNRPGALLRRLIEIHAIVPAADVDIPSFTSLDAAVNRPVHHWMGAQRSVKDLVEAIAGSVNATPIVTFQGKFSITRAFGGTNALTINRQAPTKATRVTGWRALDPETPVWRMKMRAARPGAVLSTDQILYADDLIDRGGYVSTETYRQGNMVWTDDGAQYLYTNAVPSAGTAPPTPPTTSNTHWTQTKAPNAATDAFYEDGTSIDALRPRQVGADVTASNTAGAITGQAPTATSSDFDVITGIRKPADYAGTTIPLEVRGSATMLISGNSARKVDGDGAYNGAVVGPGYKGNAFVQARFNGLIAGSKWAVIALDSTNTGVDSGLPPVNTVAPAITGSLTRGNVLTVSTGTWSNTPTAYAYQWKRGTTNVGTNANTYTTVAADEGSNITCVVTATNAAGNASATSNSVGPIAAPLAAPTLTAAPAITGSTERGNVLTVSNGTWTGSPTAYGYQWLRNGSVNIGTNANTYTTVAADEGATITCVVSATNAAGTTAAPQTAAVGPITAPASVYSTYQAAVALAARQYWIAGTQHGVSPAERIADPALNSSAGWSLPLATIAGGQLTTAPNGTGDTGLAAYDMGAFPMGGEFTVKVDVQTLGNNAPYITLGSGANGFPLVQYLAAGLNTFKGVSSANFANGFAFRIVSGNNGTVGAVINSISVEHDAGASQLPGYSSARSGRQGAVDSTGAVQWFPANAATINDLGFDTHEGVTNSAPNSQDFSAWGYQNASFGGSDTALAPDGTQTADTINFDANAAGQAYQFVTLPADYYTLSAFVWVASGTKKFRFKIFQGADFYSPEFTATTTPQRFHHRFQITNADVGNFALTNGATNEAGSVFAWQFQVIRGGFPGGGPLIQTTTGAASIGSPYLYANESPTDVEQLFWVDTDIQDFRFNYVYPGSWSDSTTNNLLGWRFLGANPEIVVINGGGLVAVSSGPSQAAGRFVMVALRRNGTWRGGIVRDGVLTWGAAAFAGAFPPMNRVNPGSATGQLQSTAKVRGLYRKVGTFATDADILAAVAETA